MIEHILYVNRILGKKQTFASKINIIRLLYREAQLSLYNKVLFVDSKSSNINLRIL